MENSRDEKELPCEIIGLMKENRDLTVGQCIELYV